MFKTAHKHKGRVKIKKDICFISIETILDCNEYS